MVGLLYCLFGVGFLLLVDAGGDDCWCLAWFVCCRYCFTFGAVVRCDAGIGAVVML